MLFCFDFDGVIADSFDPLLQVCIQAQTNLGGGRAPTAEDFRTIENLSFDELGRVIGLPESDHAPYGEEIFRLQKGTPPSPPFPDAVWAIRGLGECHTVTVITNSDSAPVLAALECYGLAEAVKAVEGGEPGTTKAERIGMLRKKYGREGELCVMIGDTIGDIRAGKEAGVGTAGVTWGFQDKALLAREAPDYLLDSPEELIEIAEAQREG
ncbi:MAG: HAD family hydrolase [Planctomycetota bacterium]|jgi:phosphoglycolate phosphatase-like HAD superfamily hydrolase